MFFSSDLCRKCGWPRRSRVDWEQRTSNLQQGDGAFLAFWYLTDQDEDDDDHNHKMIRMVKRWFWLNQFVMEKQVFGLSLFIQGQNNFLSKVKIFCIMSRLFIPGRNHFYQVKINFLDWNYLFQVKIIYARIKNQMMMMIKCFQGERSAHHPWKSVNSGTYKRGFDCDEEWWSS